MNQALRIAKWSLPALAISLVAIQLVPMDRTNPPIESEVPATAEIHSVLRRACYDCHSNETVWPWYSRIAPISWLVAHDVHEGRAALNFSMWNRLTTKARIKVSRETVKEIEDEEMPPWLYLAPHPEARLSPDERFALRAWSQSLGHRTPRAARGQ